VLVVRENGARAGDTLYLAGEIGAPRPEGERADDLLRGIRQVFVPAAVADTGGGVLAAAGEIADHAGLGFRIIKEALPVAAGTAVNADTAPAGYLFCSPRRPVATMTLTIDGVRVTPVGELTAAGRTVEEADTAAGD